GHLRRRRRREQAVEHRVLDRRERRRADEDRQEARRHLRRARQSGSADAGAPEMRSGMRRAALLSFCALVAAPAWAKPAPEAAAYLQEMERRGLVDRTAVTPRMLAEEVRRADDELVAGQPAAAAARLYAI